MDTLKKILTYIILPFTFLLALLKFKDKLLVKKSDKLQQEDLQKDEESKLVDEQIKELELGVQRMHEELKSKKELNPDEVEKFYEDLDKDNK